MPRLLRRFLARGYTCHAKRGERRALPFPVAIEILCKTDGSLDTGSRHAEHCPEVWQPGYAFGAPSCVEAAELESTSIIARGCHP